MRYESKRQALEVSSYGKLWRSYCIKNVAAKLMSIIIFKYTFSTLIIFKQWLMTDIKKPLVGTSLK